MKNTLDLDKLHEYVKIMEGKIEMILDELTDIYPQLEITIYSGQQRYFEDGKKTPISIKNKVDTDIVIPEI